MPGKGTGLAAVGFDDLVDLGHVADGFGQGYDDFLLVGDIFGGGHGLGEHVERCS